ncbi:hypothetical protein [Pseudogemmobacter bohemicus]|uniref:hypothetical protein n=1 Tax=Pseudogemmobacter bohemicus TaxID=2250708 RepID=UPI0018E4F77B|nr:hypothetical protein [Pseudogemmobacter bohemicus]
MTIEQNNPLAGTTPISLPPALRKPRLRRDEVSQYLELAHGIIMAPSTLATLATRGGGPPFQKVNRTPLYPRVAVDDWAQGKLGPLRDSTSEE